MSNMVKTFDFNGAAITAYRVRGRECWIAQDVARVLGYEAKGWSKSWRGWLDELIKGQDFDTLKHRDLNEFKRLLSATVISTVAKTTQLTVLYEPGLNLVCIKTEKPLGKVLRRFIAEKVLPDIRRSAANARALQDEIIALNLRLTAGDAASIWERETVLEICRIYRKPWDGCGVWPRWLSEPLGKIYRIVLGDVVYGELKARNPEPRDGSLNYQFLTEARHKLIVNDMGTVSALLRMSTTHDQFFSRLRGAFRRGPIQLEW